MRRPGGSRARTDPRTRAAPCSKRGSVRIPHTHSGLRPGAAGSHRAKRLRLPLRAGEESHRRRAAERLRPRASRPRFPCCRLRPHRGRRRCSRPRPACRGRHRVAATGYRYTPTPREKAPPRPRSHAHVHPSCSPLLPSCGKGRSLSRPAKGRSLQSSRQRGRGDRAVERRLSCCATSSCTTYCATHLHNSVGAGCPTRPYAVAVNRIRSSG
jgi:hypothetical protein